VAGESGEPDGDLIWRWHDNLIYAIGFAIGEPRKQEWRSDLVLDIDFIAEWVRAPSGTMQFRVAPATLTFHDVGDLTIAIDHGDSGGRNAINECAIDRVTRNRLDRPFAYWRWTIELNVPKGGQIAFCASGFTQTLRREPILLPEQHLPRGKRPFAYGEC
jgi:hypothetical protein